MPHKFQARYRHIPLLAGLLLVPNAAFAAVAADAGTLLLGFFALTGLALVIWMSYLLSSTRSLVKQHGGYYSQWFYLVLAFGAIAYAGVSMLLGKTTIGHGVAIADIEPKRFWFLVKVQLGFGCALLALTALFWRRRK